MKPREAFLEATDAIAEHFVALGWRYARSGPHLTRRADPFVFEIALMSSTYNVADQVALLRVAVLVRSKVLARWRDEQPVAVGHGDAVAAGLLGNLAPEPLFLEWNVADSRERAAAVADVISHLERFAVPWLGLFEDQALLVGRLAQGELPNMWPKDSLEMLVWLGHLDVAAAHARRLLVDPDIADAYAREVRRLGGRPPTGTEPLDIGGAGLARAVLAHGIDV